MRARTYLGKLIKIRKHQEKLRNKMEVIRSNPVTGENRKKLISLFGEWANGNTEEFDLINDIMDKLESIPRIEDREILCYHWLMKIPFSAIAKGMGYSLQSIYNRHHWAIRELQIVLDTEAD